MESTSSQVFPKFLTHVKINKIYQWGLISIQLLGCFLVCSGVFEARAETIFIVDKKTNTLSLWDYSTQGQFKKLRSIHTTLGKSLGDKRVQDDKKTPEGIYYFTREWRPPSLPKKFGALAFPMDYPNSIDQLDHKTGYGIMLHATDDPARLQKNQDSDGCIVVSDSQILELAPLVRVKNSVIAVYDEFREEYLQKSSELLVPFREWISDWEHKDLSKYIGAYASAFRMKGMNLAQYQRYKAGLNQKYDRISVEAAEPLALYHPKYSLIRFQQKYQSWLKSGQSAFVSTGRKTLYLTQESGRSKILIEDFEN